MTKDEIIKQKVLVEVDGHKIYRYETKDEKEAIDIWRKNVNNRDKTGYTPVILGGEDGIRNLLEGIAYNDDKVEDIINKSEGINAEKWFKEKEEGLIEEFKEYAEEGEEIKIVQEGEWREPRDTSGMNFTFYTSSESRQYEDEPIIIAFVPTSNSYEAPAYLKYGNWNDCPKPEVHVAIHKYWNKKYSSIITCMTSDIIETYARNETLNKDEAMKLAKQQFLYCRDIVEQGTNDLSTLAKGLIENPIWYFWWD
jgi:hypothetical protein